MALLTNINGKFSVSDAGAVTFNDAFTFPTADGAANYILKTDGGGQLAWAAASTGTVTGTGVNNRIAIWNGTTAIDSDSDFYVDGDTIFTTNLEASGNGSFSGTLTATNYFSSTTAANIFLGSVITKPGDNLGFVIRNTTNAVIGSFLRTSNTTSKLTTDNLSLGGTTAQYVRGDGSFATYSGGGGTVTGTGTANTMPVWTSASALGDSIITTGSPAGQATVGGVLNVTGDCNFLGSVDVRGVDDIRVRFLNSTTFLAGLQVATTAGDMISSTAINDFAVRSQANMIFSSGGNTERMRIGQTHGDKTFISSYSGGTFPLRVGYGTFASFTPTFVIADTGNVGIGEIAPAHRLSIKSTNNTRGILINNTSTGSYAELHLKAAREYRIGTGGSTTASDAANNFYVYDATAGAHRLTLLPSGNVGIGTDSPSYKLEVNGGTTLVGGAFYVSTDQSISTNFAYTFRDGVGINNPNSISATPNAGYTMCVGRSNNGAGVSGSLSAVGTIKATAFTVNIDTTAGIGGSNGDVNASETGPGYINLSRDDTAAAQQIRFEKNGALHSYIETTTSGLNIGNTNVGIGLTSPAAALHVMGDTGLPATSGTTFTGTMRLQVAGGYGTVMDFGAVGPSTGTQWIQVTDASNQSFHYPLLLQPNGGNVGIGMTAPDARLNVEGVGQANNPTVAIDVTNSDAFNHGLEIFDGNLTTGETVLMAIGHSGSTKLTAIFGFIRNENSLDQNLATIGFWGADNLLTVAAGGNVGIGTGVGVPAYKLDVQGTIRATGDVIAYSDERVKENIKTIDNSLEKVSKLRGVEFNKIGDDVKSIGVIAQEIEKILPEVVKEDDKGMKSVAYGNISGLLIEAVKELKAEIEELKFNKCNCK